MKPVKYAFIVVASLLLTCGLILVGCQLLDQGESGSPTAPSVASGVFNYWGQTGREGGEFTIFVTENRRNFFSVNVPENDPRKPAEGYSLWYRVYRTSDKKSHAYVLYFKALEEATVCIGILDGPPQLDEGEYDVLEQVVISYEHYDPEALVHKQGPLEMYAFPGEWVHWDQPEGGARVPAPDDPPEDNVLYSFSEGKTQNTMENRCGSSQTPSTTSTSTSTTSTSTSTTSTSASTTSTSASTTSTSTSTTSTSTSTTSTSTSTTSTTTTTTTTTTTLLSCPPPSPFDPNRYISLCDDTINGSGDQATAVIDCDGTPTENTFGTVAGNAGVKVIHPDCAECSSLECIPWTSQSGSWLWLSTGETLAPGEEYTLEESYSVAIECWCN